MSSDAPTFRAQVDRAHYEHPEYLDFKRWTSVYCQVKEVMRYRPVDVLEVGGGIGVAKRVLELYSIKVIAMDIADDLRPDITGSVTDIPLEANSVDLSCAFQVLEHISFDYFGRALSELIRVSRKAVIFSVPDFRRCYGVHADLPLLGKLKFLIERPFFRTRPLPEGHQHAWEVNRPGLPLARVLSEIRVAGGRLKSTYRNRHFPYHRFFVLEK